MSPTRTQRNLGLPTGTETLQLRQAHHVQLVGATLQQLFERWGYTPAETPLVDYAEPYRTLLSDQAARETYRAIDRQGELLLIRPDTTLFLAKQLGVHLQAEELPVRVCYADQVVRVEGELAISRRESYQAGIELIGVPGIEGDAEILLLLESALRALRVTGAVLHVGSHAVVAHACRWAGSAIADAAAAAMLHRALRLRDRATLHELLTTGGATADRALVVEDLLLTIRPTHELATLPAQVLTAGGAPLADLGQLLALVAAAREDQQADEAGSIGSATVEEIRLDLSEVGGHDYYTGIAFGTYLPHAAGAIARGGRYDSLLRTFGFDAPSVGFSIYPRKLALPPDEQLPTVGRAVGKSFADRLSDARRRRAGGERVAL